MLHARKNAVTLVQLLGGIGVLGVAAWLVIPKSNC
jgi:hypothetical protein